MKKNLELVFTDRQHCSSSPGPSRAEGRERFGAGGVHGWRCAPFMRHWRALLARRWGWDSPALLTDVQRDESETPTGAGENEWVTFYGRPVNQGEIKAND